MQETPMRVVRRVLLTCAFAAATSFARAADDTADNREAPYPLDAWHVAESPESLGYSSAKLAAAHDFMDTLPTKALMIVVDGVVLADWGDTDLVLPCHSIRKSLLSALYGIEVERGTIRLKTTLDDLGIDDEPVSLTAEEKRASIVDLLTATSGVYHAANYEGAGRAAQRPERFSHPPGTFWYYNNWDFNALGTIYEQATGRTVFEGIRDDLALPLGMQDFQLEHTKSVIDDESVHAAYTVRMSARDLSRLGLLFLRDGRWGDEQIVPATWVAESTAPLVEAEHTLSYGYMWWVAKTGRLFPGMPAGDPVYAARGTGGHTIAVFPEHQMVIVHRSDTRLPIRNFHVGSPDLGNLMALIIAAKSPAGQ